MGILSCQPEFLTLKNLPNLSITTEDCCFTVKKEDIKMNNPKTKRIINAVFMVILFSFYDLVNYEYSSNLNFLDIKKTLRTFYRCFLAFDILK